MSPEYIIQIFSGLLTPIIAIVAIYIAWQQLRTAKQKLRLDKYDRTLHIYEEVKKFILIVIREGDVDFDEAIKFRSSVSEADFLFDPTIVGYIDEIYGRALTLRQRKDEYRDSLQERPDGYNHSEVVAAIYNENIWFGEQLAAAKEKFSKYLSVNG